MIWLQNRSQSLLLTPWGRVTHICVNKLTIIGSDNGLSPGRRQAIIWTNDGILLIGPLGTNFSEILIAIYIFSFKKMHLKMSSGNWQPFCLGLNVLKDASGECPSWLFARYPRLNSDHMQWHMAWQNDIGWGTLETGNTTSSLMSLKVTRYFITPQCCTLAHI